MSDFWGWTAVYAIMIASLISQIGLKDAANWAWPVAFAAFAFYFLAKKLVNP